LSPISFHKWERNALTKGISVAALLPAAWGQDANSVKVQVAQANDYLHQGMEAQRDQQWDKAIDDFTQAIRVRPDYLPAYIQRGEVFRTLGRFDEAIADFGEVIRRYSKFSSAYYNRGSVYLLTHKPELALADAEEEIRQKPDDRLGYLLRARARLALGDQAGAAEDKTKAEELKANTPAGEPLVDGRQIPGAVAGAVLADVIGPLSSAQASGAQRIGSNVMAANLVHKVAPEYPSLAKQARIQGTVRFAAMIGKDGSVESLNLISGHPLLVDAARTAVQQWQYKPTLLNGEPVRVATTVDVNFTLRE
jgi:TonB family protein